MQICEATESTLPDNETWWSRWKLRKLDRYDSTDLHVLRLHPLYVILYGCETWSFTLRVNVGWGCSKTECRGEYLGL